MGDPVQNSRSPSAITSQDDGGGSSESAHKNPGGGAVVRRLDYDNEQSESFFRSAPMALIQLYIPSESASAVVAELGALGNIHFIDLNSKASAFQRTFTTEIRQLDVIERSIRFLIDQATAESVSIDSYAINLAASRMMMGSSANQSSGAVTLSSHIVGSIMTELADLDSIGAELAECEKRVIQLDESQQELSARFLYHLEWHGVLKALDPYLRGSFVREIQPFSQSSPTAGYGSKKDYDTASLNSSVHTRDSFAEEDSKFDDTLESGRRGAGVTTPSASSVNGSVHSAVGGSGNHNGDSGYQSGSRIHSSIEPNFVTGCIARRKLDAFQRVLWRALRGNVVIRSADMILDYRGLFPNAVVGANGAAGAESDSAAVVSKSAGGKKPLVIEPKSAFVAYVHGRETLVRLRKYCQALGAVLLDVSGDGSYQSRNLLDDELTAKLHDMCSVLDSTRQAKRLVLSGVASSLEKYLVLVTKKKVMLDVMNRFSCDAEVSTRRYYLAEGWCPVSALPAIEDGVRAASEHAGVSVAPVITVLDHGSRNPPTWFPTNKVTQVFLDLTESYGVANYGEANPALFMVATFPFLFAVMFGDVGHALILIAIGLFFISFEKRVANGTLKLSDTMSMPYAGRYAILMMGMYSVFTGFIYNDIFSLGMSIFPTAYDRNVDGDLYRDEASGYVYPFGLDVSWTYASNAMTFTNSFKLKASIVLGILQMLFGLTISLTNFLHRDEWLDVVCTFVPQMLFMTSIFGYLLFLVVYKWCCSDCDVSITATLITMILQMGDVQGPSMFYGQQFLQRILIGIAFICVPWMFLAKPLYLIYERRRMAAMGYHLPSTTHDISPNLTSRSEDKDSRRSSDRKSIHEDGAGVAGAANMVVSPKSDGGASDISASSTARKVAKDSSHATGHHGGEGGGEIWVMQLIHTVEFVLGAVSNTASYLRLWALSLAHSELSHVLWKMAIADRGTNVIGLCFGYVIWILATVSILVGMEGMSAFLHALRLHWVEFNNKFYSGSGYKFAPFSLQDDQVMKDLDFGHQNH